MDFSNMWGRPITSRSSTSGVSRLLRVATPPDALEQRREDVADAGGSGVTAAPRELLRWSVGELLRSAAFDPTAPFVEPPLCRDE
jgi:hypothetical protein